MSTVADCFSGFDMKPTRVESKMATGFRQVQYPDMRVRLQGAYQWTEGNSYGLVWRDLPVIKVDSKGNEFEYD